MLRTLTFAALMVMGQAGTSIAETCIDTRTHLYGVYGEDDLPFSDFNYLSNTEEFNTLYRMTRFQLCENESGELMGLRAHVTRYEAETMTPKSRLSMNKIGTVSGTGISCGSIVLDAENGEYLTGIQFAYANEGVIDYIQGTSNKGQKYSKGQFTATMTQSEMTGIHDSRILAFHGYEADRISAIGQVSVNLGCIKGVTTTESVDEPILVDIEELENSSSDSSLTTETEPEQDEHLWIYISVSVFWLVLCTVTVGGVLLYAFKTKKWCWSKAVSSRKTMPMRGSFRTSKPQADIEFAGQSEQQKRQSMKKMSKIVEVNESNDLNELEDIGQKFSKQNAGENLRSDSHNVQSLQSLAQVTDSEEPSKRGTN